MEEEQEQPTPNDLLITSETTRLELEPGPPSGGGGLVLRHLAMMECHTWLGIGGRTGRVCCPRRISREITRVLPLRLRLLRQLAPPTHVQEIKNSLGEENEYRCLCPDYYWDMVVPQRVERDIGVAAHRGGATGTVRVDIRIHFEFVYSEPEELLRACAGAISCSIFSPDYRDLHDKMTIDPDSLMPDYV